MKYIVFLVLMFSLTVNAKDIVNIENAEDQESVFLIEDIDNTDYAARLELISTVILESIDELSNAGGYDYYNYVETYKVLEIYKGELPKYIIIKGHREYFKKYKGKQFYITNSLFVLGGFCKGRNHYYFPRVPSTYIDREGLRKSIEKHQLKKKKLPNLCDKKHWLAK